MLEEWDLDIMARINAQNDEKDRENAERAAASKLPGCAPDPCPRACTRTRALCFAQRFLSVPRAQHDAGRAERRRREQRERHGRVWHRRGRM
eukprot:7234151-Prymnesium_polylepis.2